MKQDTSVHNTIKNQYDAYAKGKATIVKNNERSSKTKRDQKGKKQSNEKQSEEEQSEEEDSEDKYRMTKVSYKNLL